MTKNHRELISLLFTFAIILMAAFVTREFFLPLTWAAIIAIATWPLYERLQKQLGGQQLLAATLLTIVFALVVVLPIIWLSVILTKEIQLFTRYIMLAHNQGVAMPLWLNNMPWVSSTIQSFWDETLGKPHGLSEWISGTSAIPFKPLTELVKKVGIQVLHRSVVLGFSILCLFFFYKDGYALISQINSIGNYCLNHRWQLYAKTLPGAIKATVNGIVFVGISVGLIMGVSYAFTTLPAPALLGAITAILAMIPFAVTLIFAIVGLILVAQGEITSAIVIISWGTLVMFVVDHFVRPYVIGGSTSLPFLAVLFGILGGVKTLGIVGLFIGPVVMVLLVTLWHEPELFSLREAVEKE